MRRIGTDGTAMALAGTAALTGAVAGPAQGGAQGEAKEERLVLPSGLEAWLQEVIWQAGEVARFRYVAPGFDLEAPLAEVSADLAYLCKLHAAPRVRAERGGRDARVVVSLADRASEFGVYDAQVRQVFEAYRLEDDACIWEAF